MENTSKRRLPQDDATLLQFLNRQIARVPDRITVERLIQWKKRLFDGSFHTSECRFSRCSSMCEAFGSTAVIERWVEGCVKLRLCQLNIYPGFLLVERKVCFEDFKCV